MPSAITAKRSTWSGATFRFQEQNVRRKRARLNE
jgi:hypothetical protein